MIDIALKFVADELKLFFRQQEGKDPAECKLSAVVDDTGKFAVEEETVGITLINVEEERTVKSERPEYMDRNGQTMMLEPPLPLNLVVLFSCRFKQYERALKYLSLVLIFFHAHPRFSADENPRLDPRINRLTHELLSLPFEHLNQVWAVVGGKQLPSVFYRLRTVIVRQDVPTAIQPRVTSVETTLQSA